MQLLSVSEPKLDVVLKPGDHVMIPVERTYVSVFGAMYTYDSTTSTIAYQSGYRAIDYITAPLQKSLTFSTLYPGQQRNK